MCLHFVQRAKSYDCGRMSALSDVTCIHVRWTHITRWYLNNSNKQSRARMCSSWWCFCGSWYHFYSTTWTLIEHVGRPAYKAHAELTSRCGWVFSGWYVRISKCIRHLYGYISIADRNRLSFTYKKTVHSRNRLRFTCVVGGFNIWVLIWFPKCAFTRLW